jgi:anthranilate phosphoribosyltransferase
MTAADAIARLADGGHLAEDEAYRLFVAVLRGELTPAQVGAIALGLRQKGEHGAELVGAARALRAHAVTLPDVPPDTVDTCGTGGDGASTLNISTAAGLVAAGAGVPVAKHGNRAASGRVGGADVLEALGVELALPPAALAACLRTVGFAFLFAPHFHPALRHVALVRRELGIRTIFNMLGPLVNPAGVRRQVIGVADPRWVGPIAEVLLALGTEHAWVVHGRTRLDELSLEGESVVAEVLGGEVRLCTVDPGMAGVEEAPTAALRVSTPLEAADAVRAVLDGAPGPARDVVRLNAGAALVVGGRTDDLRAGVALATRAIDDGSARRVLDELVAFTRAHAAPAEVGA